MTRHRPFPVFAVLLATAAIVVGACGSSNGTARQRAARIEWPGAIGRPGQPGHSPRPLGASLPTSRRTPRAAPRDPARARLPSQPADRDHDRPGLLLARRLARQRLASSPVLREVPAHQSVATAAVNAVARRSDDAVRAAAPSRLAIPDGSQLLDLSISGGVATVDLSDEFESGGGSASVMARLGPDGLHPDPVPDGQVRRLPVRGRDPARCSAARASSSTSPSTRADYTDLLPDIWVDRPAFNAAIGNPAHVTGTRTSSRPRSGSRSSTPPARRSPTSRSWPAAAPAAAGPST